MKNRLRISMVLLLVALLSVGCGVPVADYDQLVQECEQTDSDLDAALKEVANLQGELDAFEQEYSGLQEEYDSLDQECEGQLQGGGELLQECDDLLREYEEEWTTRIDEANLKFGIIAELLEPIVTGDGLGEAQRVSNVEILVQEWGDPTAQEKYDAWAASPWTKDTAFDLLLYVQWDLERRLTE
jgi:predicted nuclease with TOPRIM domain